MVWCAALTCSSLVHKVPCTLCCNFMDASVVNKQVQPSGADPENSFILWNNGSVRLRTPAQWIIVTLMAVPELCTMTTQTAGSGRLRTPVAHWSLVQQQNNSTNRLHAFSRLRLRANSMCHMSRVSLDHGIVLCMFKAPTVFGCFVECRRGDLRPHTAAVQGDARALQQPLRRVVHGHGPAEAVGCAAATGAGTLQVQQLAPVDRRQLGTPAGQGDARSTRGPALPVCDAAPHPRAEAQGQPAAGAPPD